MKCSYAIESRATELGGGVFPLVEDMETEKEALRAA